MYVTPSEALKVDDGESIQIGGKVSLGSLTYGSSLLETHFELSDGAGSVLIHYNGALPPLCKEGRWAVVIGELINKEVFAKKVLSKHDEYYQPGEA